MNQITSACVLSEAEHHLLSLAANETDTAIIITDHLGRTLYLNDGFTRMLGYTLADMQGKVPSAVVSGLHTNATALASVREHVTSRESFRTEILIYDRRGKPLWIAAVINVVKNDEGECTRMVGVWTDITNTKMHEVLQHKALHAIAREAPIVDVMQLICLEVERIAPEVTVSIRRIDPSNRLWTVGAPSLPAHYVRAMDGITLDCGIEGSEVPGLEGQLVVFGERSATSFWGERTELAQACGLAMCWWRPIRSGDGQTLGTLAFYYRERHHPDNLHRRLADVSVNLCSLAMEREASKKKIRRLAYFDSLTGLPNRSSLVAQTDTLLVDAARMERPLAVLFLDLDRFKQVNDSFGHPAGDMLLCEVAKRLKKCLGEKDIAGRLSGDEFVVVLTSCNADDAVARCETIMATIREPVILGSMSVTPTASVGIALFPQHGDSIGTLLPHADMAMYRAKAAGRHRYSIFDPDLNRAAQENLKLERALREALQSDQLQLHYQPQVRLEDGGIHGVEALARWSHPEFGMVPPQRFVALAEEGGMIAELDRWVLRTACRQLSEWRRLAIAIPHVSVNISPTTFSDQALPGLIAQTLADHGLRASDLMLEVTEGVLLNTATDGFANLNSVHDQGIGLSIDDFGTGYSSLSYLHRMPVNELKLDKSFVHELESNESARTLAKAVMSIGASLGLSTIAEGVETDAQRQILTRHGCKVAQGYLFARPMSATTLVAWLNHWKPAAGSSFHVGSS
ncbi:MAG TPA: EAL domain-containing protein [Paraburkholderia sp.]|uniref:sensor domain-containing protein n=1 Tax=Paraburkholderia sp. TaxID=1926495 RepID=UPI002ED6219D